MCVFMYVEHTDFEEIPFSLPFPVRQAFSNPSLGSFPSFGRQMLTSVFALLRYVPQVINISAIGNHLFMVGSDRLKDIYSNALCLPCFKVLKE